MTKEYSIESGTVIDGRAVFDDQFAHLSLGLISPSLTNPRKTFDAVKLAELADSIKASGVHQPVLVRPLPQSRLLDTFRNRGDGNPLPTHELVAGERRYRACKLAGVETIPALIRDLTDNQVLEIQIIENLQRDDLSALEEAEGYESLCQATGISKEDVGAKIGKSRAYVYGRLKLLDLSMECKDQLRAGTIDISRAQLIARIPDSKLQIKALKEATRKDYQDETPSVRTFQKWLHSNVMLRLENAPFRITDAHLVESAGSCKVCPKRTGANPDLFADVQSADICTDPACYNSKIAADRENMLSIAAAKGMRLIDGEEAHACFYSQYQPTLKGYSPLSQERQDVADGVQPATLRELLGKDATGTVLIENPWSKELIAAVPTDEAEAMLLAKGLIKATSTKGKSRDIEDEIATLKKRSDKEIQFAFRTAAFAQLKDAIHKTPDKQAASLISPALLREWLIFQSGEVDQDEMMMALDIEPQPDAEYDAIETQMRLHLQACDHAKLYKALALHMIMGDYQNQVYYYSETSNAMLFEALASDLKINLTVIESEAAAGVRAKTVQKIRTLKAELKAQTEAQKPVPPLASAAQAIDSAGGGAQGDKGSKTNGPAAPASAVPARKRKPSAAETMAAIAAAMQETDSGAADASQGNDADSSQPVAGAGTVASADALAPVPAPALSVGTKVQIVAEYAALDLPSRRWAEKKGVITAYEPGPEGSMLVRYRVTFSGRNGGVAVFLGHQFEVLAS